MSKIKTIEEVREFARKFQSVIDLANAVEPIAKLELAEAELRGQVTKLQAERDALAATVADAKETATRMTKEAKAQAAATLAAAIEEAKAKADEIIEQARDEAGKANDKAKAEAKRLDKRIEEAKAEEADLDRDIASRKAELAALEEKLEAVHAKARSLLGG